MKKGVNVQVGPAIVEYGEGDEKVVFDITKGGIVFTATYTQQDSTVDQYGTTPVKSIITGNTAQVTVPFALHDLKRLAAVMPGSKYTESGDKKKLEVGGMAGFDLLHNAKKLVIKPTDPDSTPNDWITIPLAGAMTNPEYTYDSENERVANITFMGYPDVEAEGKLYIMGDETAGEDGGEGA